jgi:hypothetical protein
MNRWSTSRWSARRTLLTSGGLAAGAAVLAVVVAGLPRSGPGDAAGPAGAGAAGVGPVQSVALRSFKDCDDLLRYYRENAARIVGPYGLPGQGMGWAAGAAEQGRSAMTAPKAPGGPVAADGSTSSTGTNIQVAGVDEADVAKLSGGLLLSVADGALRVSTVAGGKVTAAGVLRPADWTPHQMLVHGDTVLVTGYVVPTDPAATKLRSSIAPVMPGGTRIAEVDVSDPAKPRLVRSIDVNGSVVGARLVDGVARLAVTSTPGPLSFPFPDRLPGRKLDPNGAPTKATLDLATAHNRKIVRAAGLDTWLPTYTLNTYDAAGKVTGTPDTGRLLDCAQVASPREFAGVDTVSLLTLDLTTGIQEWDSAGVVATGSSVYATAGHTYVTTSAWLPQWTSQWAETTDTSIAPAQPDRTAVHLFRTTDGTASEYVASGEVPGSLHDQFSMDEHDGVLRVASTTTNVVAAKPLREESPGSADEPVSDDGSASSPALPQEPQTVSQVTVLRQQGDRLVRVGTVGGLGKTETIRSVRFMGDIGYVVTFRQTDPLYTIDLTDPQRPAVAGELKIPGYSAYLHPAGPGRLLGVGQDADAQGRVKGVQLSLFDVSDPANPRRLDAVGLPNTWSEAESDHHAFTFAGDLALVPYGAGNGSGVLAVRAGDGDLAAPVTLEARPGAPRTTDGGTYPMRTFVRDGVIYTLTNTGVATHDATRLAWTAFSAFGS